MTIFGTYLPWLLLASVIVEAGEDWPTGQPAKFLLQVRLDEPALGQRWQGRLLREFPEKNLGMAGGLLF
jgi:hypothetical protein